MRSNFRLRYIGLLTVVTLLYSLTAGTVLYYCLNIFCGDHICIPDDVRQRKTSYQILELGHSVSAFPGLRKHEENKDTQYHQSPWTKIKETQLFDQNEVQKASKNRTKHLIRVNRILYNTPTRKPKVAENEVTDRTPETLRNRRQVNSVHKRCKRDFVSLSRSHLPRTALASSPGSGNTWTRHLLQQATGIRTGSIYNDGELQMNGFWGENKCTRIKTCLVIKTHEWHTEYQTFYDRAILILRHPRDSILSSFHFFNGGRHVREARPYLFHTDRWVRFAEERVHLWFDLNNDWVKRYRNPLHIVFYEELKANPVLQIEQAIRFLNFTMTEADKMCLKKNLEGKFRRQHKNKIDTERLYSGALAKAIAEHVKILTTTIRRRFPGKPVVWTPI
ncbi:WSCD family member AAEL009094-like [Ylistrum balloti]|uniref:WSCD family member AAEL009094-like n=1 Tax=Ylistrum balloti TaxID=509963 RepID=UPI002905F61B|nr:WSCD family member AAEL009094-like [Ylistrum balloti]